MNKVILKLGVGRKREDEGKGVGAKRKMRKRDSSDETAPRWKVSETWQDQPRG